MNIKILLFFIIFVSSINISLIIKDYNNSNINRVKKTKNNIVNNLTVNKVNQNVDLKISWDAPSSWEEIRGNDFSLAVYKINNLNEDVNVSITQFPGDAGGIENNVNRWRRQLELPEQSFDVIKENTKYKTNKIGGFEIHKIINNNNSDLAFLCMVQSLESSTVFVKLQASVNGIKEIEKLFYEFCLSFRYG